MYVSSKQICFRISTCILKNNKNSFLEHNMSIQNTCTNPGNVLKRQKVFNWHLIIKKINTKEEKGCIFCLSSFVNHKRFIFLSFPSLIITKCYLSLHFLHFFLSKKYVFKTSHGITI